MLSNYLNDYFAKQPSEDSINKLRLHLAQHAVDCSYGSEGKIVFNNALELRRAAVGISLVPLCAELNALREHCHPTNPRYYLYTLVILAIHEQYNPRDALATMFCCIANMQDQSLLAYAKEQLQWL